MRRNPDDDEDPFGDLFGEINDMLAGKTGEETEAVDVHEYDDELRVVADIPDASEEEIEIQCDGRILAIRVARDPRPVVERLDLPAYVDDQSAQMSFNNGILEVTLDRTTDPANIGFQ
ncbi:Hsp20/alpha crystallin family protein [Halorientalis pallida]|uniref:Hsp20/alpha crystallin family protein n=1 Tax=Halorientalis pallida TaxID=2479928 RepID=A0A498KT89_9EURY|nr:Hsp20/alpha crystallin family protein [Halorientalis pallida]RXK48007.1 Hsp20/alpha crystallin family protein [Halorientalis pallida]